MKNRVRELFQAGKIAVGAQLRFGSPVIDTEHAPQTPRSVQGQLQAAGCTNTTPLVRLARNDPDLIKLYLDMGAMGVVAPFVNRVDEAATGAQACRYPPVGTRGWGPSRAGGYGLHAQRYTEEINDCVLYIPIIESAEAVANIDSILAVDGV